MPKGIPYFVRQPRAVLLVTIDGILVDPTRSRTQLELNLEQRLGDCWWWRFSCFRVPFRVCFFRVCVFHNTDYLLYVLYRLSSITEILLVSYHVLSFHFNLSVNTPHPLHLNGILHHFECRSTSEIVSVL